METIGAQSLWSMLDGSDRATSSVTNRKIREDRGHKVSSYLELVRKISELQFRNREYVFLFRGQDEDYKNQQGRSSLRPSLLRSIDPVASYEKLKAAESMLTTEYRFTGHHIVRRHQALRWALLQHYKVCDTPLLDVTQSLRIAASFASYRMRSEAFVFVLGVPNISGAVTASNEAGLEVIRLSSVCPPEAVRPHIQEGYLLSEFPELSNIEQKKHYENYELDFGKRIVAKFRFNPRVFWKADDAFPIVPSNALYPVSPKDPVLEMLDKISKRL